MNKLIISLLFLLFCVTASALTITGFEPDEQVVYKKTAQGELKLHVFYPENHKVSENRPAILFFHGGGWSGGYPSYFYPHADYLASRGMVAISAEYRLKGKHKTTPVECVMDAKSAIRWVRKNAKKMGIDPEKVIVGGGSAGGHIAAAAGTATSFEEESDDTSISFCPNALVLFNPVFDNSENGFGHKVVKAYWNEISPMHNITDKSPPTIVFLGTKDRLIPVATAKEYKKRMEGKGLRCDLNLYEGQGHGFFNYDRPENYQKTVADMDRFLSSLGYLTGEPTVKKPGGEVAQTSLVMPKDEPTLFVDADDSNTVMLGNEGATFWTEEKGSKTLWRKRAGFGFKNNETNEIFERITGDLPILKTTVSGLEPGKKVGVYVSFLSNTKEPWQVVAGLNPDSLTTYSRGQPEGLVLNLGVAKGAKQDQLLGYLGNAVADANGKIAVYVHHGKGSGASKRTWYEGIAIGEPAEAEPVSIKAPAKRKKASKDAPNVLFIAVDDLRTALGCYGDNQAITPNIDRLAEQGVVFDRAYCNVPICMASRVALMTGMQVRYNDGTTSRVEKPFVSMAKCFRDNGYYAVSNGKIFHKMSDRAEDWSREPWRSSEVYYGKGDWAGYNLQGLWRNPESAKFRHPIKGRGPYCESADVPDNAYMDGMLAEKTIADLKELAEKDQPFFLGCGFWKPHLPLNAPKKYWDLYDRNKLDLAANHFLPENAPKSARGSTEFLQYGWTGAENTPMTRELMKTEAFQREALHAYYACASYIDAQIGKVLNELDELGLRDNTIVVLWSDHGWLLGEHTFWGKHNTFELAMNMPLIVSAPGMKKGERTSGLTESIDIYPTLCDLTGVEKPGHLEGESFVDLMRDPSQSGREAAFGLWNNCVTVKTDRYRYTEWKNGDQMLFDHENDSAENKNIANHPEYAEVVKELSGKLKAAVPNFYKETGK
jgi:iduronate 2-sulfatase